MLKKDELIQIQKELRRYEAALESLKADLPDMPKKRRTKNEFQNKQAESQE